MAVLESVPDVGTTVKCKAHYAPRGVDEPITFDPPMYVTGRVTRTFANYLLIEYPGAVLIGHEYRFWDWFRADQVVAVLDVN